MKHHTNDTARRYPADESAENLGANWHRKGQRVVLKSNAYLMSSGRQAAEPGAWAKLQDRTCYHERWWWVVLLKDGTMCRALRVADARPETSEQA